ncbi:MAG: septal ring lytic transglycosylase RlpA family protein [Chthoniobacterales bacterium]
MPVNPPRFNGVRTWVTLVIAVLICGQSAGFASTKKHHSSGRRHSTSKSKSSKNSKYIPVTKPNVLYLVQPGYSEIGVASWYGGRDVGRKTANGETYRPTDVTAAHLRLPFNTLVRVQSITTGKSIIVRINDRGPYIRNRIIDLSEISAKKIGVYERGLSKVKLEVVKTVPIMMQPNLRLPSSADTQPHSKKH